MTQSSEATSLAVPGVVSVAKSTGVVETGAAAGWIAPPGINQWSQELSLVVRAELSEATIKELGLTLPEYRIAKGRHPLAFRAASASPLLAVTSDVVTKLIEKGVRVHTVGFDRVTGGFIYFAKGGKGEELEIHGDLLEIIGPTLEVGDATNAEIEKHLERFIDRVLVHFSGGLLDEPRVELANALPRLAVDARGMQGVDLDAFEAEAAANDAAGKKYEASATKLAAALDGAKGAATAAVPLFGEATKTTLPAMEMIVGGKKTALPARALWVVKGEPKETEAPKPEIKVEAPKPEPKPEIKPEPKPEPIKIEPKKPSPLAGTMIGMAVVPGAVTGKPAAAASARTATPAPVAKPAASPKPAPVEAKPSPKPAPVEAKPSPKPAPVEAKPAAAEIKPIVAAPVLSIGAPATEVVKPVEPEKKAEPLPTPAPIELKKAEPAREPEPAKQPEAKKEPEKRPEQGKGKGKKKGGGDTGKKKAAEPEKKAAPEPEKKAAAAAKPVVKEERPIEKAPEPPPPEPKSNTMLFVIIGVVVLAIIAFLVLKKH